MTRSRRGPSLVALVAVVATACAGLLAGCTARPADASLSHTTLSSASLAAVRSLLDARAHAVRDRDEQAWRATLEDPEGTTSALVAEFARLSALPWAGFDYADVRPTGGGADLGVTVTCVSRLTGERADTRTEEHFTLVRRASGWRISGHRATPTLSAPWWSAGARATRGQHAVVVGAIDADTATWYAHQADAAVEAAARAWPTSPFPAPLVVIVASSTAEAAALLDRSVDRLDQVAAVTEGPVGPDGRATADRVVLNPQGLDRLSDEGRRFVLVHEAVHVLLRSALPGSAPAWLVEGFADTVAYAPTGLPPERIAAAALADVRANGAPAHLPTAADFDGRTARLDLSYQRSWVLVSLLEETYGADAVRQLIERATTTAAAPDVEAAGARAVEEVLGTSVPELTWAWQRRLLALAAAGSAPG